jgi:hypothetical protein
MKQVRLKHLISTLDPPGHLKQRATVHQLAHSAQGHLLAKFTGKLARDATARLRLVGALRQTGIG